MTQPHPTSHTHAKLKPHQAHGHGHDHHHHEAHGHAHHHAPARAATPRRSVLALSGFERLALILPAILVLWALTYWAVLHG